MSDEGVFRPPGAPGAELSRRQAPEASASGRPADSRDAAPPAADVGQPSGGDAAGGPGGRRRLAPQTGWRLAGVGLAAVLYLAAGLPWYRIGVDRCAREVGQDDSAALRAACADVALDGWQVSRWGMLLALAAGGVMLLRLARRGPVGLDLLAPLAAGLAGVLAVRALFDPADRQLDLTWPGPLTVLPLLAALTAAGVQVYRVEHLSGVRSVGEAGQRLGRHLAEHPPRVPGWLRPASVWRHRRRWLAGAGVVCAALVVRACAAQPSPGAGSGAGVTNAQVDGGPGPGRAGPTGAAGKPGATAHPGRTTPAHPAPDGAALLGAAGRAVGQARSVQVHLTSVRGADITVDLSMTSTRSADGTVTTSRNAYNVRRVGSQCWVQHLEGYGALDWVPTCTIPPSHGFPSIDLAALTDWQVMVAALPDPAGARAAPDGEGWTVRAADGTVVSLPGGAPGDPLPVRVHSPVGRYGGATDVEYSGWNDPVTITPP